MQQYLQQAGLAFQHLLLDRRGQLATQLGLYGLPVTLYFSAEGQLQQSHMGEFLLPVWRKACSGWQ